MIAIVGTFAFLATAAVVTLLYDIAGACGEALNEQRLLRLEMKKVIDDVAQINIHVMEQRQTNSWAD